MTTIPARLARTTMRSTSPEMARKRVLDLYREWMRAVSALRTSSRDGVGSDLPETTFFLPGVFFGRTVFFLLFLRLSLSSVPFSFHLLSFSFSSCRACR